MRRDIIQKTVVGMVLFYAIAFSAKKTNRVYGQSDVYVASGASVYVFSNSPVTVWGNATNYGSWGSAESSLVRFYGATWANSGSATMPGAGTFLFQQPRPAPYAANTKQYLEGGYTQSSGSGCSFPDIEIDNSNNVGLINSDAKTRDTFTFTAGHVLHDGLDFTVGDGDPGTIMGYNETRFFVTNGTGTSNIGFLERENVQSTATAFPVGIAVGDYTPGQIANSGTADDFSMRVYPDAYDLGYSGTNQNDASVARTWDISERTTGGSNVTLELQHNAATEGATFSGKRSNHYVTHFAGTAPNGPGSNGVDTISRSNWDLLKYANLYAGESGSGYITTGSAVSNAVVTKRANLSVFSPYTKTVYDLSPLPVSLVELSARWEENDGVVSWVTASEVNNSHFVVERSFDGIDYSVAGKVGTAAPGGNSSAMLSYRFADKNIRSITADYVFYRLVQFDYNGTQQVHGPVLLAERSVRSRQSELTLYPNPTQGQFTVVKKGGTASYTVTVLNMAGQPVHKQLNVSARDLATGYVIDADRAGWPCGIYVVQLESDRGIEIKRISIRK